MKSFRKIEKIVGNAHAMSGQAADKRILTDAKVALINSSHNQPQAKRPAKNLWRFIMESKVTKYSAAAAVALAFVLVLSNPFGGSQYGGVVLADVVQKMENIQTIVHKEHRYYYELGKEEPFLKADVIKHCSQNLGVVEEQYTTEGELMYRVYVLGKSSNFVALLPETKKYFKMPLRDSMSQVIERLTPQGLLEHFMEIDHKELGRSKIDGREVDGFEAIDTEFWPIPNEFSFLFPVKQITWRFWIDVENLLPVKVEYEVITDKGLLTGMKALKIVCKAYALEYYQESDEKLFKPDIPDDYIEFKVTDLIPTEAKAGIVGLGILPAGIIIWRKRRKNKIIQNVKS
ncbi:MAG: hypothetical protein JXA96_10050 [Sedimentisphaerales bacterium]|nr:hypothetical protein [Sedimentisphaerales bacterium]